MAGRRRANDIGRKAKPFLTKIEGVEAEIESAKGVFMSLCKGKRKIIKDLYKAAKDDADVAPVVLKGIVTQRRLQKKIDKIPTDFDFDEAADYRALEEAFGPLGAAAARAAGFGGDDVEGEPMTAAEAMAAQKARDHEDGIARIGRGAADGSTT